MTENEADAPPYSARYPEIASAEGHSTIPKHILDKLPDDERFIVESVSRLEQRAEWLSKVAEQVSKNIQDIDRRLHALETRGSASHGKLAREVRTELRPALDELVRWKNIIMSRWTMIAGCLVVLAPSLIKSFMDWIAKKF